MSSHSKNPSEMTCAEFESAFDQYVDDMLDPAMTASCRFHVSVCAGCDREVTRWQQTRILLSTAVADLATAVDVSSVRNHVLAALDLAQSDQARDADHARRRGASRDASVERARDPRRSRRRPAAGGASSPRLSGFAAAWRFTAAAGASALTAAAAVLLLTSGPETSSNVVASASSSSSVSSSFQPAAFEPWSNDDLNAVVPAAYARPPLARPEASHVDGLEAAPGQLVSTWVQPGTNARVIWVQDRGLGAPVRTAGLDR